MLAITSSIAESISSSANSCTGVSTLTLAITSSIADFISSSANPSCINALPLIVAIASPITDSISSSANSSCTGTSILTLAIASAITESISSSANSPVGTFISDVGIYSSTASLTILWISSSEYSGTLSSGIFVFTFANSFDIVSSISLSLINGSSTISSNVPSAKWSVPLTNLS